MASPIPVGSPVISRAASEDEAGVSEVYRAYTAFMSLAGDLGYADLSHRLVLCEPLSLAGEAPIVAASIAFAGTLCIEPDPAIVRYGIRSGAIDFTVNNLDEALRALKNELRKGLSIAICLEGDPAGVLAEMQERGVQPDVLCSAALNASLSAATEKFVERGAAVLNLAHLPSLNGLVEMNWWATTQPGKWLPLLDDLVATYIPLDDAVRRSWVRRAPRYLGRTLRTKRYLPMTPDETRRCVEAFAQLQGEGWQGIEANIAPLDKPAISTSAAPASPSRFP
jgi:urocanate hydratase